MLQHDATSGAKDEPEFVDQVQNQTVAVGRDATLQCQVKKLSQNYKVGWLKVSDQTILTLHKRVITHNNRIHVTHDEHRTWNLHIKNVQQVDQGCYMCQINTAIMKKQLGCITVMVPPDIKADKTSSDTEVDEGANATLFCHATGQPTPVITWRREDGSPFSIKLSKRRVDSYQGDRLVLYKVRRSDMGAFMCIASNNVPPTVSKRIMLNIKFPPHVKVDNELVGSPLGEKVTLTCFVEAFPNAISYWSRKIAGKRSGEMLLDGPEFIIEEKTLSYKTILTITIKTFSPQDAGMYTCASTNSIGRKESTIRLYELKRPVASTNKTSSFKSTTKQYVSKSTEINYGGRKNRYMSTSESPRIPEATAPSGKTFFTSQCSLNLPHITFEVFLVFVTCYILHNSILC